MIQIPRGRLRLALLLILAACVYAVAAPPLSGHTLLAIAVVAVAGGVLFTAPRR